MFGVYYLSHLGAENWQFLAEQPTEAAARLFMGCFSVTMKAQTGQSPACMRAHRDECSPTLPVEELIVESQTW